MNLISLDQGPIRIPIIFEKIDPDEIMTDVKEVKIFDDRPVSTPANIFLLKCRDFEIPVYRENQESWPNRTLRPSEQFRMIRKLR